MTILGLVLLLAVASLTGCTTQHVDPTTGQVTTQPVEPAEVVEEVGEVVQTTAPAFGPWGIAVAAVTGVLVPVIVRRLRKKK